MAESLGKCIICGGEAGVLYPLLSGEPAFCSKHHNPKDAGRFGCDFTGPDDFDIPDIFGPTFNGNRETFIWTDKDGNKHRLEDIDNDYLSNIISFLRKRLSQMDFYSAAYWSEVTFFLEGEQRRRLTND